MLFQADVETFVKNQLADNEELVAVSWRKRTSSARIKEAAQGIAALFLFIFLIVFFHPMKGGHLWALHDRLTAAIAFFVVAAIVFLLYCLNLYRVSDRRVCAITNQRIIIFEFRAPVQTFTATDLNGPRLRHKRDIHYDSVRSSRTLPQNDGSGLLILEVYSDFKPKNPANRPWTQLQLELENVAAIAGFTPLAGYSSPRKIDPDHKDRS